MMGIMLSGFIWVLLSVIFDFGPDVIDIIQKCGAILGAVMGALVAPFIKQWPPAR